jgi:hypothetical protein
VGLRATGDLLCGFNLWCSLFEAVEFFPAGILQTLWHTWVGVVVVVPSPGRVVFNPFGDVRALLLWVAKRAHIFLVHLLTQARIDSCVVWIKASLPFTCALMIKLAFVILRSLG